MDEPLYTLAPGVSSHGRLDAIYAHVDALGYVVRDIPGWLARVWRHSTTAPWSVIYLHPNAPAGGIVTEAAVMGHEATHARQFIRAGRWGRYWLAALYAFLPWPYTRRWMELEAEAWETATAGAMMNADATPEEMEPHVSARALGGWRWPHFTGGSRGAMLAEVRVRAAHLLERARAGRE